jgi:membrane fusion protein (multidrug efflux system)
MYVRARLGQAVNAQAITVPQQAVIRNTDGASVMLVDANGKVVAQSVKADTAQGDTWVVSQGLKAGDRVIVEGLQKVKPGATVKAVAWNGPAASNGANPPQSAAGPASAARTATVQQAANSAPQPDQKSKNK